VALANLHGWMCVHFRPARTDKGWRTLIQGDIGFVDCVFARDGVVLFVELKSEKGRPGPGQEDWAYHLGAGYRLWRPSSLEALKAELR
jgi:hypothetical protein